jgi:enamine deaminase RidA (YjgF/YER057c/UK114 family)
MTDITRHDIGKRMSEIGIFNKVAYLAGQVANRNPDADIAGQTEEVLGHIDRLLAKAGTDKTRLLHCQIFLKNIQDIDAMNAVWDRWAPQGNTPPRATVQALLGDPAWRIEIVVCAALA